jgi:D-3-phosphoglycerate dehydrogenase
VFRILAADKLAPEGLEWIRQQPDAELVNRPGLKEEEYAGLLADCDAMIVRSGIKVTGKMLANPGRLQVIARAGVGVDNIDLEAATQKGILVVNTAEASTITTAEHAFTLMCALARNVGPASRTMHEGGWDRNKFEGTQLAGKTLGVVGFGRIGQTLAKRALAFEMEVAAYDPFINAQTMLDGRVRMFTSFEDLLPLCDILSFHVPLNEQTKGMLNLRTFAKARRGVMVVNASRGGVVDEADLIPAIDQGLCGGAALDVFTEEPPPKDSPLRKHPRVLVTPHLGASTREAQLAVSTDAGVAVLQYLRGEGIRGAVNAGGVRVDLDPLQKSFVGLASRMAALVSPMVTRGIASVTMTLESKLLAAASGTIERHVLVELLRSHIDAPINVISVGRIAEERGIRSRCVLIEDGDGSGTPSTPQLTIEIAGPSGAVDAATHEQDRTRRIVGRVYQDGLPRVIEVNGYHMDMVPAGHMVLIQNEDRPGMIGLVGTEFGQAQVNIADMAISRRGHTALMMLKIDDQAPRDLLDRLARRPGILKIAEVRLPAIA